MAITGPDSVASSAWYTVSGVGSGTARAYAYTYACRSPPWSVCVAATIAGRWPAASPMYVASVGVIGASGLTITPSGRAARIRLSLFCAPIASPTPTGPAVSVASRRLRVSELENTSTQGHAPIPAVSWDAYSASSHFPRSNLSLETRTVVRFEYIDPWSTSRGYGMQYCMVMPYAAVAAAMLSRKASRSVKLYAGCACAHSQSCSYVATPPAAR